MLLSVSVPSFFLVINTMFTKLTVSHISLTLQGRPWERPSLIPPPSMDWNAAPCLNVIVLILVMMLY